MVGARHIIQRQFIRGYDVMEDENDYKEDSNMYLMEFMSAAFPNSCAKVQIMSTGENTREHN